MPYDGRIINILQEKKLTMARVSVLWVYLCSHHQSQSYIRQKLVLQQTKCYIKCFISVIKIKMKKRLCPTWLYIYIYIYIGACDTIRVMVERTYIYI